MKRLQPPFNPPIQTPLEVVSSPRSNPIQSPSQSHPHTPKGFEPRLEGRVHPSDGRESADRLDTLYDHWMAHWVEGDIRVAWVIRHLIADETGATIEQRNAVKRLN